MFKYKRIVLLFAVLICSANTSSDINQLQKENKWLKQENQQLKTELAKTKADLVKAKDYLRKFMDEKKAAELKQEQTSSVANMHTFQTIIETFAVDTEGHYPKTVNETFQAANKLQYFKEVINPISKIKWNQQNPTGKGVVIDGAIPQNCVPGAVYYSINKKSEIYQIYVCEKNGLPLKRGLSLHYLSNY